MDGDAPLTPTQRRVLTDVMGVGQPRPRFDEGLGLRLRDELEVALAGVADRLGDQQLSVSKQALSEVHACERHHVSSAGTFSWSVATACGTVTHKAIELGATMRRPPGPEDLVDLALDRLAADLEWGPGAWLSEAGPVELAELRGAALDRMLKFSDEFPPLKLSWRPRLESSLSTGLCGDRIWLRGKVDLALGRPHGSTAGVLIVDFKSGRPGRSAPDDLRFYALLETLRTGVPPFRVATWYLDSGQCHAQDVGEDVLASAARRVVDGARLLYELRIEGREPAVTPGPACGYCTRRGDCAGAVVWQAERAVLGLDG
ncbi:MAG TPA: PD-(D/E)XK nuclease family protein [Acidimicrobiales bacterium]|nr:PD-(D/E)XK nuclease family protein [Acidimicrobiales bacterium]